MEISVLKSVFISSKKYKISLLISHTEVSTLYNFIKTTTNKDVLIFNTNLGLEIYYNSTTDYTHLITNSFFLISSKQNKVPKDYRIQYFTTSLELKEGIHQMMARLSSMPLAFKCYSQNLFNQINTYYSNKPDIIEELFSIWQEALIKINLKKVKNKKIKEFIEILEELPINTTHNTMLKQLLIKSVINAVRRN